MQQFKFPLRGLGGFLILLILTSCGRPVREQGNDAAQEAQRAGVTASKTGDGIMLRTTPVRDQGATSACWIYAMLACLETERLENYNDSLSLSADWLIRKLNEEETLRCQMMKGGTVRHTRGMGPDALRLIDHHGLVIDNVRGGRNGDFYFFSMHYTPKQFANSIYKKGDWQWVTSFTHHPFGEEFALEVPDNYRYNDFLNVPIDTMLAMTVRSLKAHHPVFWEGTMKKINRKNVTQGLRQALFEGGVLTDDHAMAIVGMSRTKDGTPYFILKNSWGKDWGRNGYCRMSFEQFKVRTMCVGRPTPLAPSR